MCVFVYELLETSNTIDYWSLWANSVITFIIHKFCLLLFIRVTVAISMQKNSVDSKIIMWSGNTEYSHEPLSERPVLRTTAKADHVPRHLRGRRQLWGSQKIQGEVSFSLQKTNLTTLRSHKQKTFLKALLSCTAPTSWPCPTPTQLPLHYAYL